MVGKAGRKTTARPNLNLFFLNDKLHKKLRIVRVEDTIETWCYPDERRVAYTYSDTKRNMEPAYTTIEVSEMIGRHPNSIKKAVGAGAVEPAVQYTLTQRKALFAWRWNERRIMELHKYFMNVHRGRPRKDGRITPQKLPTARELRAMIRQEEILYRKMPDGSFMPTWQAEDFT